jgi:hypothetical protein
MRPSLSTTESAVAFRQDGDESGGPDDPARPIRPPRPAVFPAPAGRKSSLHFRDRRSGGAPSGRPPRSTSIIDMTPTTESNGPPRGRGRSRLDGLPQTTVSATACRDAHASRWRPWARRRGSLAPAAPGRRQAEVKGGPLIRLHRNAQPGRQQIGQRALNARARGRGLLERGREQVTPTRDRGPPHLLTAERPEDRARIAPLRSAHVAGAVEGPHVGNAERAGEMSLGGATRPQRVERAPGADLLRAGRDPVKIAPGALAKARASEKVDWLAWRRRWASRSESARHDRPPSALSVSLEHSSQVTHGSGEDSSYRAPRGRRPPSIASPGPSSSPREPPARAATSLASQASAGLPEPLSRTAGRRARRPGR